MGSASRLLKNTTVLLASNFVTKGLSALFVIYLAIYLEDYGFGQYNFALSFAMVFIIFSDLGLDALTIKNVARDTELAGGYLETVGILRFWLSLVMIAISVLIAVFMELDDYLVLVVIAAGFAYMFDKMSGLFYAIIRAREKMEYEAGIQIAWKAIQTTLGIGAIYFGFSLLEIMLVMLVSSIIKAIIGYTILGTMGISPKANVLTQRDAVRGTMPFAAYEIGNAIYMNIAVIMLYMLASPQETGWFSAGLRLIMFMLLIPSAFDAAIYPLLSKLYGMSRGDMSYAYGKSIKFSLVAAIPAAILLAILSREAAGIFGSDYENTANALVVLAALLPLYTLNMLMKTALWSGDAQKQTAINIWIALAVIIGASYFLITSDGYIGAALALVTAESVFLVLNFRDSRRKGFPMGRYLAKPIIAGLGMIGAALAMNYLSGESMSHVHIATMSFLVYVLVILLSGFITRSDKTIIRTALFRRKP